MCVMMSDLRWITLANERTWLYGYFANFSWITSHYLPNTIANVLVALRSFLAEDFSRFFFDALFTL